jgi:hypothetical protein
MAIFITNDGMLHAILSAAIRGALKEVIDKMFEELQKCIARDVYGSGFGDIATGELINSWKHESYGMFATLQFDPSMLPNDPDSWIHGSQYDSAWRDTRALILDIIQGGYRAYNAHTGMEVAGRPFWDDYLALVDANYDDWVRAALKHQGLDVI